MRVAHGLGMKTTATLMFGSLDTPAERIEHLRRIRDLQDETGGFTAFIPWTFQAGNTELAAGHTPATGFDYLRLLAVSRIYLDNLPSIQASWVTQGLKMGQVALAFGANDMGSTMIEENVVAAAGVRNQCDVDEMVRLIRAAVRGDQQCASLQTGCSVAPDLAVQRIALQRRASGGADQPHHLVDVALVAHAGRGDDVLLDHRGAHVVGAEGQGHLPHLQALGDPGGLDAGQVVEVDAAHGEQAQVVEAGGGRV